MFSELLLLSLLLSSSSSKLLTSQQFSRFSQKYGLTVQALIYCSAKNVLAIQHVLSITALCIGIYRAGRRLSSFKLSCNLFVIIPVVDSTNEDNTRCVYY